MPLYQQAKCKHLTYLHSDVCPHACVLLSIVYLVTIVHAKQVRFYFYILVLKDIVQMKLTFYTDKFYSDTLRRPQARRSLCFPG